MQQEAVHIIMPVKDSVGTVRKAVEHLYASEDIDWRFTVYNDFSTAENTAILETLAKQYGFTLVNWSERTNHPSPNYRLTLIDAQRQAIEDGADLLIIESDVLVYSYTVSQLRQARAANTGMLAAVTHDEAGDVNFPYLYARDWKKETIETKKRLSFCCTLLTLELLQALPFETLDATKDWFDVTISHKSIELGFKNLLIMNTPVVHLPHSSRPWKRLKYTNPLKYYLLKLFCRRDKI